MTFDGMLPKEGHIGQYPALGPKAEFIGPEKDYSDYDDVETMLGGINTASKVDQAFLQKVVQPLKEKETK